MDKRESWNLDAGHVAVVENLAGEEGHPGETVATSGSALRVITTWQGAEELRAAWQAMQDHPNADFDFYRTVIESREEVVSPYVLAVEREGVVEAMLLGRLERIPLEFRIGYKKVARVKARVITIITGGCLGTSSRENDQQFVNALLESLRHGEADAVQLHTIRVEGTLCALAGAAPGIFGRDYFPEKRIHRRLVFSPELRQKYVSLAEGGDRHFRALRKEHADLRVEVYRDLASVPRVCREAEEIAVKGYQRGLGAGFANDAEHQRLLEVMARAGRLRAYFLYFDGAPRAYWIGEGYRETFYPAYTGFDAEHGKHSPGTYLFLKMAEDLLEFARLDLGLGDAPYKQRFSNQSWEEASLFIFAASPKGRLLHLLRTCTGAISHAAERLLQRSGLLQRVKTSWKSRLRRDPPKGLGVVVQIATCTLSTLMSWHE